ncbi:MAG: efflux RND transporter permease subunit [Myxococcales bacterium]|nr:efflux RND transporter permease subunit [Myxococcales bacterium]
MDITRGAIEKNRITIIALLVVLAIGYGAFNSLPRAEDPGFTIRIAQVMTIFPGASPERVEKLVTDRLEKAIQEIPELDFVSSTSKTGLSVIMVNIKESYKNMRPIWDSLRRKIERETPKLPEGAHKPIVNDEFGDVFGIVLALTGDGYNYAQLKDIADDMRDELLKLPDAAKVDIYGAQAERVFVEFKTARLAQVGLSPLALSSILKAQNIVIPGGSVKVGPERLSLEPSGNFNSVREIENALITLPKTGRLVYLKDLATVRRGYIDPPQNKVHTSTGARLFTSHKYKFPFGRPATAGLVIAISMRDGGRLTDLGAQVEKQIRRFNQVYPVGIQVEKAIFQPKDVQTVVDSFTSSLMQAIGIVMGAMLLFLGLRTGLVVSALIPTAMMASLMFMQMFGIGLDQMSLSALIIALGMLVDNGVVMAESIMVMMEDGKSAKQSAIDSAKELRIPLLTSSLTTSAAFLPIFLAKSAVGEYTASLFIVVTIALLASWVLSLTMTPALCALFLKVTPRDTTKDPFDTRFYRVYRGFLTSFVRRPLVTVVLMLGVFFGAMSLFRFIPNIFFPPSDRPTFEVELSLLDSSDIEYTRKAVQKLEAEMLKNHMADKKNNKPGVVRWVSFIGQGGPRYYLSASVEPPNPAYALMLVTQTDRDSMDATLEKLRAWSLVNLPHAKVDIKPRALGPPVKYPIVIRISGKERSKIFTLVDAVKAKLRTLSGMGNVTDDWGIRTKKVVVNIDQRRARRAGVTSQDVAVTLQTLYSGLEVTQYREEEKVIPVVMRAVAKDRFNLAKLETTEVISQQTGKSVPLKQIADLRVVWEASKVMRRNRTLTVSINATLQPGTIADEINKQIRPWLTSQSTSWGIGYSYVVAGEAEEAAKGNKSINDQLPVAFFIIIMLLVSQFNSVRRPIIILLTLPLGLIGVVLGLLAANSYFGFMTFLGVISLFGIVINNAIVLIDRIKIEIDEEGRPPAQAVVYAAQQRLRPILLTTATTIVGLFPLWFGGSPMFKPMAIAIIFGLAFATVLTLGIVPTFYSLFFRVSFRKYEYDPTAREKRER